jgi:uncharacterized protein
MLAPILRAWNAGQFELVLSEPILAELERVLATPYFSRFFSANDRMDVIQSLRLDATIVEITVEVHGVATHPEDDLILATAVSGQVDYLVTRDRQLLRLGAYEGVRIVSTGEFLAVLQAEIGG